MADELPPNVLSLEKRKKKKSREEEAKIPEGKIFVSVAEAINHEPHPELPLPEFPERFLLIEVAPGVSEIARPDERGVLTPASENEVVNAIMAFCHSQLHFDPAYAFTHRRAVECMKTWKSFTLAMRPPPAVRFLSNEGYCWQRLPFDLEIAPTPHWDRLFGGIQSKAQQRAIKAWIGSLFFQESYRQQYVWIWGSGGNGKGCIARFLHRVMGKSAHFISSIPREPNQFWTRQFVNKRLIVIPDCGNYHFPASGLFKTLTGDDPIQMEIKGGSLYSATIDCKFFFTGQEMPNLSSEHSDRRRAIFARLEARPEWQAGFEDRLWGEGGAFLNDCIQIYREECPDHGPIPTENEDLDDWISTLEEPMEEFFNEWLEVDPEGAVTPTQMQATLRYLSARRGPQLEFLKWLDRTHGVRKLTIREEGATFKSYRGVRLTKTPPLQSCYPKREEDEK